jgi:hypothetical protein
MPIYSVMSVNTIGAEQHATKLSPELALVDESLASRARDHLPAPDDTLARLEHDVWLRRLMAVQAANTVSTATESSVAHVSSLPHRRAHRGRTKALAAVGVGASLMLALLLGVNVNLRGDPAGADASYVTAPAAAPPRGARNGGSSTPRETPAGRSAAPSAKSRTFAWAPIADASSYHVEFFRNDSRIFAGDVTAPRLSLPAKWQHAGRSHELEPGVYRWYVWPVVAGLRQAHATVQAELVVG